VDDLCHDTLMLVLGPSNLAGICTAPLVHTPSPWVAVKRLGIPAAQHTCRACGWCCERIGRLTYLATPSIPGDAWRPFQVFLHFSAKSVPQRSGCRSSGARLFTPQFLLHLNTASVVVTFPNRLLESHRFLTQIT
jgi:hypothetical protein